MEKNDVQTDRWNTEDLRTLLLRNVQFSTLGLTHLTTQNTNPDISGASQVMAWEVKKTLKEMKNKARGMNSMTSDVVILGGEESSKQ